MMGKEPTSVRRVCVVRLGGMGDILLATPALRALHDRFQPEAIDYIVGHGMAEAVDGIGYLRRVVTFDKDGDDARMSNFLPFLRDLRAQNYDLFLNFQPSAKTVLMGAASGARRVITFRKDRTKQHDTGRVRHAVDDFIKELKPLGIVDVPDRQMDFFIPDAARATLSLKLAAEGLQANDKLLAVNPNATRIINRWPPEKFVAFLDSVARDLPSLRIVLTGGKGDADLVCQIQQATRHAETVNLAGKLTVKELGALYQRCAAVVTGDTGPLHIASAVGAPIVCLSGAADPDRTGPLHPKDLVVINRELSCVPCQDRTCRRHDIACMTQMPVEWVLSALCRRLENY